MWDSYPNTRAWNCDRWKGHMYRIFEHWQVNRQWRTDRWKVPVIAEEGKHARLLGCGLVLKIVDILSNRQPCDCSVWHHAVRSMCKSCDTSQFGDRTSIRYKICKSHRRHTLIQRNWNGRKPCATRCGSSTGENRCVITVTTHKFLSLISECKENQIDS